MQKKKNQNKIQSSFLFYIILFSTIIGINANNLISNNENLDVLDNHGESNLSKLNENHNQINAMAEGISWWDEDLKSRQQITVTEPGVMDRVNEPIDLLFNFNNNTCLNSSILLTELSGETQIRLPSQVWNITFWTEMSVDTEFIQSCTVTTSLNIDQDEIKTLFIYYSNETQKDFTAKYYTETFMDTSLTDGRLVVKNNRLHIELAEKSAFDKLKLLTGPSTDENYHTQYSMSPSSSISEDISGSSTYYSPDDDGFIRNWIIAGPFVTNTYTTDWDDSPTVFYNGLEHNYNPGYNYVRSDIDYKAGDLTQEPDPGLVAENYAGPSTWSKFQSNISEWINFDTTSGFTGDYRAAYAFTYVYFPSDVEEGFVWVGSDDGVRVWMDHNFIYDNHDTRGPGNDYDAESVGLITAGWHSVMVMAEDSEGQWGFSLHFSTHGDNSDDGIHYTKIDKLIVSLEPKTLIKSINIVESGPIFMKADVEWNVYDPVIQEDMKVWETITVYQGMDMYQSERTFWWDSDRSGANSAFGAVNTMYNTYDGSDPSCVDKFVKDGIELDLDDANEDYSAANYTFVYDSTYQINGDNDNFGQGVFVTNYSPGENAYLTSVNSTGYISGSSPNLIVGSSTDLDNFGPHGVYGSGNADYNVSIEYWEMAKHLPSDDIGLELNNYYDSLLEPLQYSIDGIVEPLFNTLTLNLTDVDGNPAPGIKASLYNTTDDWSGIDPTFDVQNLTSLDDGIVNFPQLKYGNYSIVLSYQVYNLAPIELRTVNVTLDASKTIDVENLNLTRLTIDLKFYDPALAGEPITGANVSLYWNATNEEGTYVGYEISNELSQVQFYYLNQTESAGNYSIKVSSYGAYRYINQTIFGGTSLYTLNFTLSEETYKIISVEMDEYETNLDMMSGDLFNTHFWSENITVVANYTFGLQGGPFQAITGASVRMEIRNTNDITTLIYNDYLVNNGTPGFYGLPFNSTDINFHLNTDDLFSCIVIAEKIGFSMQRGYFNIKLKKHTSDVILDFINNTAISFGNDAELSVFLNDSTIDKGIGGATLTCNTGLYSALPLSDDGNGYYSIILQSDDFAIIGPYTIVITVESDYYEEGDLSIDVELTVIPTVLIIDQDDIEVYWNHNFSLDVHFSDSFTNPLNSALVTWQLVSNPSINGVLDQNSSKGDGWFSIEINSTVFGITRDYSLKVIASLPIYKPQEAYISLALLEVKTQIKINDGEAVSDLLRLPVKIYQTDDLDIELYYIDDQTGQNIANTSIKSFTWSYTNNPSIFGEADIETVGDHYKVDFNTTILDAGNYILLIAIGELNHEQKQALILLTVEKRIINYEFANDLAQSVSKVAGEAFTFSISLTDGITGDPIIGATVVIYFNNTISNITLVDEDGDGIYNATKIFTKDEANAFFQDRTFVCSVIISAENFASEEKVISITIKMNEIASGFPTFYLLLAVAAVVIVSATLGGYKYVQYAKIPAFVKLIDKVKKDIGKEKELSREKVTVSVNDEVYERFGDLWEILDLDYKLIMDKKDDSGSTNNFALNDNNIGGN